MRAEITGQMVNFDSSKGDRIDPVARVCRALFIRSELCPCRYPRNADRFPNLCVQCQNDRKAIELAWDVPMESRSEREGK